MNKYTHNLERACGGGCGGGTKKPKGGTARPRPTSNPKPRPSIGWGG